MISSEAYVYRKACALARRMRIERDKKQAAHTVCLRLLALLSLNSRAGPQG